MSTTDTEIRQRIQSIPVCVVISGKRKSGKDHTVNILSSELNAKDLSHVVIHLSYPIKQRYAQQHGLNLSELSSSGPYKEVYRKDMVRWSEEEKKKDPYIFAREALLHFLTPVHFTTDAVLIADARRPADLAYFFDLWGRSRCLLIRVVASECVRKDRGWIFTSGVDDAETECALDSFSDWDFVVENNCHEDSYHSSLLKIIARLEEIKKS